MKVCEKFRDHPATEFCEKRKVIVVKGKAREAGKQLILNNKKTDEFCLVKIDGGYLIQQSSCDFLLANCTVQECIFIELKGGSDVRKACRQIHNTIQIFRKENIVTSKVIVQAVIITNNTPRPSLYTTPLLHLRNLVEGYGGEVIIQTRQHTLQN